MRPAIAIAFFMAGWLAPVLRGFDPRLHAELITQAFTDVPEAKVSAETSSAVNESDRVDECENLEDDQYKHSMRPARTSLPVAQRRGFDYIEYHMLAAVKAAMENDAAEAGRHLGRVLHAVQDRKHLWCSCGSTSNPGSTNNPQSEAPCSTAAGGCTTPGIGNHALIDCLRRNLQADFRNNYQLKTEGGRLRFLGSPTPSQLQRAKEESRDFLNEFVQRLRNAGRP